MDIKIEKRLGKLSNVRLGLGGYQEACIGLSVTIEGDGWGVGDNKTAWDANLIKHTDRCKWSEADRDGEYVVIMRYLSDLLAAAKVNSVEKLNGIPVEAEFDGKLLKGWRVLTEVL